jgi:hypothetical protein
MGWSSSTHTGDEKCAKVLVGKPVERKDRSVAGRRWRRWENHLAKDGTQWRALADSNTQRFLGVSDVFWTRFMEGYLNFHSAAGLVLEDIILHKYVLPWEFGWMTCLLGVCKYRHEFSVYKTFEKWEQQGLKRHAGFYANWIERISIKFGIRRINFSSYRPNTRADTAQSVQWLGYRLDDRSSISGRGSPQRVRPILEPIHWVPAALSTAWSWPLSLSSVEIKSEWS